MGYAGTAAEDDLMIWEGVEREKAGEGEGEGGGWSERMNGGREKGRG